jgi:AraC-like DNA-binding protein
VADRTLYAGQDLHVGEFRARPSRRPFEDTGPIRGFLVVFPRTSVVIRHAGADPVVADPTRAMLYNRGQEYTRRALGPRGDECEYFSYRPEVIAEALSPFDEAARDRVERPWTRSHVAVDATTYLLQRTVVEHLAHAATPDALFVEESMLRLLARCARAAIEADGRQKRARRPQTERDHRALADHCRRLLAQHLGEPLSLFELARAAGVSPFHLARVFQRDAGTTIHAYRHDLRLRTALERVSDGEDLTRVALDLGYTSHSHFTAAFRRAFAATPSGWRGQASKILTAERGGRAARSKA